MNIDKDIDRCKELIKIEHSNWIGMSNQEAISNVLSEFETLREISGGLVIDNVNLKVKLKETTETLKCTQDSWYKDTQELETYKKIAQKLVDYGESYGLDVDIDWARNEVLNDKQS